MNFTCIHPPINKVWFIMNKRKPLRRSHISAIAANLEF